MAQNSRTRPASTTTFLGFAVSSVLKINTIRNDEATSDTYTTTTFMIKVKNFKIKPNLQFGIHDN